MTKIEIIFINIMVILFYKVKKLSFLDVEIAIGKENGKYYVQTTDTKEDTYHSESIVEDTTRERAYAIAKKYSKKYSLPIQIWN